MTMFELASLFFFNNLKNELFQMLFTGILLPFKNSKRASSDPKVDA